VPKRLRAGLRSSSLAIRRLMEPCVTLPLHIKPRHGYDLAQALARFGLANIDASTVYRLLRAWRLAS